MKILNSKGNFTKAEIFNITQGATLMKVSEHVGETLELEGFILYGDEDQKGEIQEVLALKETNGMMSATISQTFIRQFKKALEFMGEESFNIRVVGGKSKSGRDYITCEIV